MLIFLWTDILLWFLVLSWLILFFKFKSKPYFTVAIDALLSSKIFIITSIVLGAYLSLALLDSIHYQAKIVNVEQTASSTTQNFGDVVSVLDYILSPWSTITETTFAAPFSKSSYVKDKIINQDGTSTYVYKELLKIDNNTNADILVYCLFIISIAIIFGVIFYKLLESKAKKRQKEYYIESQSKNPVTNIEPVMELSFSSEAEYQPTYKAPTTDTMVIIDPNSIVEQKEHLPQDNFVIQKFHPRMHYGTWCVTLTLMIVTLGVLLVLFKSNHVLGTNKIGQDILYITLKSIRTGVVIGSLTTIFMLPLAVIFGTIAGYYGGWWDDAIQYIYTTLSSIPGVLLIAAFTLIIQTQLALHPHWFTTIAEQADLRLVALCFILGITSWSALCRLLRAETLKIREMDYITAAKAMKVSNFNIIIRHIIPNLVHIIIISVAIDFSSLVLAEAVLSYIGVGVDPTTMSWGNMINSARLELAREPIVWWPILGAFIPMFIFVLSLNLFAEQVREAFDPRIRL